MRVLGRRPHSKPERQVEVAQRSLIGPLAKNLLGNVCHPAQCRSEIEEVFSSASRASQLDLRLGDPRGEASETRQEVTCQIVDLGKVKQPFPPATQVCELLLQYLRPGVAQRLLGSDCLERCDRGVQMVGVEELPKPSV
jgi:hypothetical protein